jgi:hypothetical protein
MNAAGYGKWDVVNLLLQRGANAKIADRVSCGSQSMGRWI